MGHRDIIIKSKKVMPHKAFMKPDFGSPTVLVDDQFDYVELWLKRYYSSKIEPQIYWQQARNFYQVSKTISKESRPLTSYYCMLNASKALLSSKSIPIVKSHGISGSSLKDRTSLANEVIKIKGSGIFISLAEYFGTHLGGFNRTVRLKDVLYNIPFIHRAYTVTYRGSTNLFLPIKDAHFVRQNNGNEAWFCAEIKDRQYCKKKIMQKQRGWELDESEESKYMIRSKRRFLWQTRGVTKQNRLQSLIKYHKCVRRDIKYIHGFSRLWYFKRNDQVQGVLPWSTPALVFMAMHRLSELTRYDPKKLSRHFDSQHNWLLSEFINLANDNFIDQIASEITGQELLVPRYRE